MSTLYTFHAQLGRLSPLWCILLLTSPLGCVRNSAPPIDGSAKNTGQPQSVMAVPHTVDFGEVPIGKSVSTAVRLVNSGDTEIEIGDIRPSCGCTIVGLATKRIARRGEIALTIEMKPGFFPGQRDGKICVQVKGKEPSFLFIPVNETVIEEWTCVPSRLEETINAEEQSKDFTFSVYRRLETSREFSLESSNKRIEILSRKNVKSKEGFVRDDVRIRVHCPHNVPRISGDVGLAALKDGKILLTVPAVCYRGSQERLSPPLIALGTVKRGEKYTAFVSGPAATIGKLVEHGVVDGTPIFKGQLLRAGEEARNCGLRLFTRLRRASFVCL